MSVKTSRRAVLASALAAALISRGVSAQKLGKIADDLALAHFPALPDDQGAWPTSIVAWADIAGYCEAAGIEKPNSFGEETVKVWSQIGQRIPMNDDTLFLFMNAPWGEIVGFEPWDIDQLAVAFDPPDQLRIYSGAFDPDRIEQAFAQWSYSASTNGDFRVLVNPEDGLDPSRDLDRYALGRFNHVGVTESLVIASRSAEVLAAAIDVAANEAQSIADGELFADVAKVIEGMHGYVLLNGALLGSPTVNPGGLVDGETIPPAHLFLGGIEAKTDGQLVSLIADLGDVADAKSAVPVVQDRIDTLTSPISKRPYTEDLEGYEVDVVEGTGLLRLTVPNDTFAMRWMRYIFAGDLLFLATKAS